MPSDLIAVVDLETTGLSPWRHDRVVEIGIVMISPNGEIQAEYETLVNPSRDIGPTSIHGIAAGDVLNAPAFDDVAGDVLQFLSRADVLAGHNVSFDHNFLIKEYERLGFSLPEIPLLCTCRLFGRLSLEACCDELDVTTDGMLHRAISDAQVTALLVSILCQESPELIEAYRLREPEWPSIPALNTPRHSRDASQLEQSAPPRFLQRIAEKIHHDVESEDPEMLDYLNLIDRVLEDRRIDEDEEELLVDAATHWKLSPAQLQTAHQKYLEDLAVLAWADGIITDTERRDLHLVAKLLGQEESSVDQALASASRQLQLAKPEKQVDEPTSELAGKRVCFTGELQCTIGGERITRTMAEALASQAGLTAASGVTKKLDILIVADPNTQSSKARKARDYGIRILSDVVFWRLAGISVD